MDCSLIVRDELAERYLLGQLNPAEQEAYEKHYFECARCFGELRRLQALCDVLRTDPPPARAPKEERVQNPWWGWAVAGALAASVVVVALLRQSGAPEPIAATPRAAEPAGPILSPGADAAAAPAITGTVDPSAAVAPPEPVASSASRRMEVLARLARVDPPRFSPGVLRGATDEATASFQEGMKAYVAGDYGAAIRSLRKAARLDTERSDIAFFLAASELLAGNTADAVGEFVRTIAMEDTPFLEEAHFYLAKAYLAQGDADRARAELVRVRSLQGERVSEAGELLVQLESAGSE
jgi:tetratricopeptide (TPR) repeat protein